MTKGYFGPFGGAFIPEILHETFQQLTAAYEAARNDPTFWRDYVALMENFSGRPTPLTLAENISRQFGQTVYLKREDLNHTGAHKANNVMGQGLLVRRMGKKRVIAETGAGQHGVATATMAARLGLECVVYMGAEDVERQRPNVFWMEQLGARVVPVTSGTCTLKDAINEAMRDWVGSMEDTHYVLGTACGPHPFPEMVTWFQSLIGEEARDQSLRQVGRLPSHVYACVGGGPMLWAFFRGFWTMPRWNSSLWKPGGVGWKVADMRPASPLEAVRWVWRTAIRPFFCRMTMDRCVIPIRWPLASIMSAFLPFWRT